jgi:hypothetical protein
MVKRSPPEAYCIFTVYTVCTALSRAGTGIKAIRPAGGAPGARNSHLAAEILDKTAKLYKDGIKCLTKLVHITVKLIDKILTLDYNE